MVKYRPSRTVVVSALFTILWLFSVMAWCAQVTVAPEARSTAVFKRGMENGLIGVIPVGGQVHPISGVGARLLWKNAQKNAKKNSASEQMNSIIPSRRPDTTFEV